jgi:hypothetical protein
MLLTQDELTLGYRMWVVRKFGEGSKMEYLVHCDWCTSMWLAIFLMPPVALLSDISIPWGTRIILALYSIPAASLVTGLLSKLRG